MAALPGRGLCPASAEPMGSPGAGGGAERAAGWASNLGMPSFTWKRPLQGQGLTDTGARKTLHFNATSPVLLTLWREGVSE